MVGVGWEKGRGRGIWLSVTPEYDFIRVRQRMAQGYGGVGEMGGNMLLMRVLHLGSSRDASQAQPVLIQHTMHCSMDTMSSMALSCIGSC
jgi:hypothetical protein